MSDSATMDSSKVAATKPAKAYRFSVLLTGIGRLFRSFVPLTVVIVVNALVQAILIGLFDPQPTLTIGFALLTIVSLVFLVWGLFCFNIVALEGATGKPRLSSVFRRSITEWTWFLVWAFVIYVFVVVGLLISSYLAAAIVLLFPFVTLAAADRKRNPLKTNFLVLAGRPWRYLFAAIIFLPLLGLSAFFTSMNGFFVGGGIGSFITWIYLGVIGAWYMNALGLIYRSTVAGQVPDDASASVTE